MPHGGKTTFNVGMISGGTSVNTIAQEAEALYEFRSDCREDLEIMEKAFCKVMEEAAQREGVQVEYDWWGNPPLRGGGRPSARRCWEHRALWAVYRTLDISPKPRKAPITDCNIPMSLGIPSVYVGSFMGGGAYPPGVSARDNLKSGLGIALDLVLGYCHDDDGEEVWSLLRPEDEGIRKRKRSWRGGAGESVTPLPLFRSSRRTAGAAVSPAPDLAQEGFRPQHLDHGPEGEHSMSSSVSSAMS